MTEMTDRTNKLEVFCVDGEPIPPRTNEQKLRLVERDHAWPKAEGGGMHQLSPCAVAVFRKMVETPLLSLEYGAAAYSALNAYWSLQFKYGKRPRYGKSECFRALQELESCGLIELARSGSMIGRSDARPVQCWRLYGPRPETTEETVAAILAARAISAEGRQRERTKGTKDEQHVAN